MFGTVPLIETGSRCSEVPGFRGLGVTACLGLGFIGRRHVLGPRRVVKFKAYLGISQNNSLQPKHADNYFGLRSGGFGI